MNVPRQNIKLDADSGTPLYMQMAGELAAAIRKGTWSSGEALPSERVLADALGVSRITSRKAMALLAEQGLIRRVQGVGTFIMPGTNELPLSLIGVTTLAQLDGFMAHTRWLSRSIRAADFEEATHLDLPPLANVAHLECLRVADGIVMALDHWTLPAAAMPDPQASGDSPCAFLSHRGMPVVRALQRFQAVNAPVPVAQHMGIAPGTALVLTTRIGYTHAQRPIELNRSWCHGDHYLLVADLCGQTVTK